MVPPGLPHLGPRWGHATKPMWGPHGLPTWDPSGSHMGVLAGLDFSKAFDKVPHQRLAAKLSHYGVGGNTLQWIQCFLSGRTQQVVVDGEQSAPAPVTSGVPQGTVLGPLLFLAYINDLPQNVTSTSRLFADDCLVYRVINNTCDSEELQKDLDTLEKWERDWQMSFNPDKCEVIRVTNKKTTICEPRTTPSTAKC